MRLLLTIAALLVPAPAALAADPATFETPSHNIRCAAFREFLRCDMNELGNPPAPRPASCEFDWGEAFQISRNGGRGRGVCASDTTPRAKVIAYGRTWRRFGFTCQVRKTNLRCTNRRGHGFDLRRGRQRLF